MEAEQLAHPRLWSGLTRTYWHGSISWMRPEIRRRFQTHTFKQPSKKTKHFFADSVINLTSLLFGPSGLFNLAELGKHFVMKSDCCSTVVTIAFQCVQVA